MDTYILVIFGGVLPTAAAVVKSKNHEFESLDKRTAKASFPLILPAAVWKDA